MMEVFYNICFIIGVSLMMLYLFVVVTALVGMLVQTLAQGAWDAVRAIVHRLEDA